MWINGILYDLCKVINDILQQLIRSWINTHTEIEKNGIAIYIYTNK